VKILGVGMKLRLDFGVQGETSFLDEQHVVSLSEIRRYGHSCSVADKNIHDQFKQDKKVNKKRALKMAR
jgi:hypothetical protein